MRTSRRRTDRRVAAVSVLVIALAALLGVLVGRASVSAADRPQQRGSEPDAGVTREAAVRAAVDYLQALRWDVLIDADRRRKAIAGRATPKAARQLDAELAAPAEAVRAAVTRPPVVARAAVLGYRVKLDDGGRAEVRIWGMALFGTGAYAPTTQWSTSDVSLVWAGERWLVDGVRSRGGPSPDSPLETLVRSDRALREVRHVP
jgi:hypothetical protein